MAEAAVPLCGISLAALRAFKTSHTGIEFSPSLQEQEEAERAHASHPVPLRFEELTTAQVVSRVIKPATEGMRCAYVDLLTEQAPLDSDGQPSVAPATVFVSHAWSYLFRDLLAALLARFTDGLQAARVYLWNDVFVVNQHAERKPDPGAGRRYFMDSFAAAVAKIGRTLLVLQPWDAPVPLGRAWCLWEIFSALQSNASGLEVVMGPAEEEALQAALATRYKQVVAAVSRIDARAAAATDEDDAAAIKALVAGSAGGFGEVNGRVHDFLRSWLTSCGEAALLRARNAPERRGTLLMLGKLLCHQDRKREAEPLLQEAWDGYGGAATPEAYEVAHTLAEVMEDRAAAIALLRDAVRDSNTALGAAHEQTLMCQFALGRSLIRNAQLSDEAETHLEAASKGLFEIAGAEQEAWQSMSWLGTLRHNKHAQRIIAGQFDDTAAALFAPLQLCGDACDGMRALLGDAHPATWDVAGRHVSALEYVANRLELISKYKQPMGADIVADVNVAALLEQAQALVELSLRGQRETLGDWHAATRQTQLRSLDVMLRRDALGEAERCGRDVLARAAAAGYAGTFTYRVTESLVTALLNQGRAPEAEPLCRELLARSVRALGDAHDESLKALQRLAEALQAQGRWDDALELYRQGLATHSETPGVAEPPPTYWLQLHSGYCCLLKEQGSADDALAEAREHLRRCCSLAGEAHYLTLRARIYLVQLLWEHDNAATLRDVVAVLQEAVLHAAGSPYEHRITEYMASAQQRLQEAEDAAHDLQEAQLAKQEENSTMAELQKLMKQPEPGAYNGRDVVAAPATRRV